MSVKELQNYTYFSKYARYNKEAKRRETWEEAVERMKQMHLRRYPQAQKEIEWAFEYVRDQKVLGSQRALQYGGDPIERKHARIYNCCVSYCDRLRFFQEAFWLLLCGCGTGFSAQRHHIDKLPNFTKRKIDRHSGIKMIDSLVVKKYVVPDTIEGWSDALGVLLSNYFESPVFPEYNDCDEVEFDFSEVRKKGSPLSSGAGKAPGPEPLRNALLKIKALLDRCLSHGQVRLRPIDAYDVVMHASDAVLSGGVRRSATICIFSDDDEEMLHAKTGDWYIHNQQRARSNNSVLLLRDKTTKEQFMKIIESVKQFGEPGFVWADSTEIVLNPCCEIGMWPVDVETGLTGWQMCNLSEINGKKCTTREEFCMAAVAASIIGTLQAGYTDFEYLGEVSERIVKREALLGVSITGMMDNPDVLFNPTYQKMAAELVSYTNKQIAELLGINPAARTTCVKPSGTASCLLGCASGIHLHHAKRYLRRVQANKMELPYQVFAQTNPHAVEDSVWSANKTDAVITFCCEVDGKTKAEMSAVEFLEKVKTTQDHWVYYGKNPDLCTQEWLSHNVSNTITVRDDEWECVGEYIYDNRESFTAVSLLSMTGDKDYPQAPFTAVYTPEEIEEVYGEAAGHVDDLIELALDAYQGNLWAACDAFLRDDPSDHFRSDLVGLWIAKADEFCEKHFKSDRRMFTYCLKDVHNWNSFKALKANYRSVDYISVVEEEDNTKPMDTVACSGGVCELAF
jgi:ribonucleoside-diphosphate reductase alpha chain